MPISRQLIGPRAIAGAALLVMLLAAESVAQQDTAQLADPMRAPLALPGLGAGSESGLLGTVDTVRAPSLRLGAGLSGLAGQMPGLRVHDADPTPGAVPVISLMGRTTISRAAPPLYALDGVPLVAPPTDLWLRDLQEVDVIEGQRAATSLGSMGADGVLHLRSATPQPGASGLTGRLRAGYGHASSGAPPAMSTRHHYLVGPDGYVDEEGNPVPRHQRIAHPSGMAVFEYPQFWNNHAELFRSGHTRTIDGQLTGRAAGTIVTAGGAVEREEGIVHMLDPLERLYARGAIDHASPGRALRFGATVQHSRGSREPLDVTIAALYALMFQPDERLSQQDPAGNYLYSPYALLALDHRQDRDRTLAGARASWAAREWLVTNLAVGYDLLSVEGTGSWLPPGNSPIPLVAGQRASLRTVAASMTGRRHVRGIVGWATLSLVDAARRDSSWEQSGASGWMRFFELESRTGALHAGVSLPHGLAVDGSLQHERSDAFPTADRGTTNWRIAGRWLAIRPDGWQPSYLSDLSFSASRGTRSTMSAPGDWMFVVSTGAHLRAEHTTETTLSADIRGGRSELRLAHVRASTERAHYVRPLSVPMGNAYALASGAEMERRHSLASFGMELVRSSRLSWIARLHAERHRQRIARLNDAPFNLDVARYEDGEQLGRGYGLRWVRSVAELPPLHAGSASAFAVNDDGYLVPVGSGGSLAAPAWGSTLTIDGVDYQWGLPIFRPWSDTVVEPIIDANPHAVLGFTNSVRWRGFTATGVVTGQLGGQVYDRGMQQRYAWRTHPDLDQSGRPEAERKPVAYYERLRTFSGANEHFVKPAGHAALDELSLAYRFGSVMRLRSAEISLVARSLAVWGSEAGYDAVRGGAGFYRDILAPSPRRLWLRVGMDL